MEMLDIVDESGQPTGRTVSRGDAHRDGILHRTAHVWVVNRDAGGRWRMLLQKRSMEKESFPGLYDTSSAGHIPAGSDPLSSALRELEEELGIRAERGQLAFAGLFRIQYEKEFYGRPFRDNEVTYVYVYREPVDITALRLQETEVDEARWFDPEEVRNEIRRTRERFCVPERGLALLREFLGGPDRDGCGISGYDLFLERSEYVDFDNADIRKKAEELAAVSETETGLIRNIYLFVRDEIRHIWDAQDTRVTVSASQVLREGVGICWAKANLFAALLRACGIPAGFSYQKLTLGDTPDTGYCIHALNAVYVSSPGRWIRLDALGNTDAIHAEFSLDEEKLAFPARPEMGEYDYHDIHPRPSAKLMHILETSTDALYMYQHLLPDEPD